MSTKPSLTLKRRLNAPPAKVYAAWTDPQQLARWMGPEGVEMLKAETDVRVGGRYRLLMRSPDGEEHDVSGVYREVTPNEKLVFSWAWKSTPERESPRHRHAESRGRRHTPDAVARAVLR